MVGEGRENKKDNDLFYTCSLIDYVARKTSPMWQIMISFRCFWMQKKLKDVLKERYSIIKLQYYICFRK